MLNTEKSTRGFVFTKQKIKKFNKTRDSLPKFKDIVYKEVKNNPNNATAEKIQEKTSLRPITVYKSLENLEKEKSIKVSREESIATTPKSKNIFKRKYYTAIKQVN